MNTKRRLSLGLDLSTQSLSAVLLDIDRRELVFEHTLEYAQDRRLNRFGIKKSDYILPPREHGQADQPPMMYLAALDFMFADIREAGVSIAETVVINTSAQQHGHVYLNGNAPALFTQLHQPGSEKSNLVKLLGGCFAYSRAPIWMTSNTTRQADFIRLFVGGKRRMIELTGSDSPLRFTGAIIRKIGQDYPDAYRNTDTIQPLSSFIPAILVGNVKIPTDFANACGTSLMNYRRKKWSRLLMSAVAENLPGRAWLLRAKLPAIAAPDSIVGEISQYYVNKYGFRRGCLIVAGSGDNPQSKVLVDGDLLSLGSSFVNMVATDGKTMDFNGYANAMYDGVGRPFMFGCRTNGTLAWDALRESYGIKKDNYGAAENYLRRTPLAHSLVFWQPRDESFPASSHYRLTRVSNYEPEPGADYAGLVETTLTFVYHYSRAFTRTTNEPLFVTGGAGNSPEIIKRVAAIWARPVVRIETAGAALGAAVAGACAFLRSQQTDVKVRELSDSLLKKGAPLFPPLDDIAAFHNPNGFLDKFAAAEAEMTRRHPLK